MKSHFRGKVSNSSKVLALVFEPLQNHPVLPDRFGDRFGGGPTVDFRAGKDESTRWCLGQEVVNEED